MIENLVGCSQTMDKITESLCKADVIFGLKPALEKFGFSKEEDLYIAFQYEDKEYKSGAIPTLTEGQVSSLNPENIKAALLDWLNKAEIQEGFSEAVAKELELSEPFEIPVSVKFMSDSLEVSLLGTWCCPCFPLARYCWKP